MFNNLVFDVWIPSIFTNKLFYDFLIMDRLFLHLAEPARVGNILYVTCMMNSL